MSKPLADQIPFAKIVTVLAISFGVGLGLCGLDATLLARFRSHYAEFGPNTIVGGIGAWAILLSGVSLILTIMMWIFVSVAKSFGRNDSEPQELFDDEDDPDLDNSR
jgi:hypothetical protein